MDDILNLPPLRTLIDQHELRARKSLGQNFLLDLNITRKIAKTAEPLEGYTVIEIGPGPGGLTRALLLEGARKVIALEKDSRCVTALSDLQNAAQGRLEVREADALKTPLESLCEGPTKIVANLPYNIATPLLMDWLPHLSGIESLTLMFQKEVAQRLCATPCSKAYGRVSVLTQFYTHAQMMFDLPPSAFTPAPKVTSTIVHLVPYKTRPLTWIHCN